MKQSWMKWFALVCLVTLSCGEPLENIDHAEPTDEPPEQSAPLEGERVFPSFEEVAATVRQIFAEHKSNVASMIREMRPTSTSGYTDDEILTMQNCGPASIAFQKVLVDHGIWAEVRTNAGPYKQHEYLLLRALLGDGRYANVIIDATYRQYLRDYAQRYLEEHEIPTPDVQQPISAFLASPDLAPYLPELLVVKDVHQLARFYHAIYDALDQSPFAVHGGYRRFSPVTNYEMAPYPAPHRQVIYTHYLDAAQIETLQRLAASRKNTYRANYPSVQAKATWNGWGANPAEDYYSTSDYSSGMRNCTMVLVDDHVWEVRVVGYPDVRGAFKFDIHGDWSLNFGDNTMDRWVDRNGRNINVSNTPNMLNIVFNDRTGEYRFFPDAVTQPASFYPQVYFRGTPNGWRTTPMTLVADHVWSLEVRFPEGPNPRFKFDINGDWTFNFGDNNADGLADLGGMDIPVAGNAVYTVFFEDRSKRYWTRRLL